MQKIIIKDKEFDIFITADEIQNSINNVAAKINQDLTNSNPLFLVVLNGSFMFAADLFKKIHFPCEISFIKLSSYEGTSTTNDMKTLIGLNENLNNRCIVIVEDIIDTGNTIVHLFDLLKQYSPSEIRIATLLFKPKTFNKDFKIHYIGKEIPNDFIVGFGLDYDGYGRNYPNIYKIVS